MPPQDRCRQCRYYHHLGRDVEDRPYGECHLDPPIMMLPVGGDEYRKVHGDNEPCSHFQ
jgi:hypothetical protein